jgi:hypothetical protein
MQELRDHLRDLIKRAFTEHKESFHDLIIIASLSKQALVALDGLCVCLEAGAAHAAHIQARAQWEATLFVEWALKNGAERWGRQFYIADIRRERASTLRAIPGTAENRAYQELWRETYEKEPHAFSDEFVQKASEHIVEIDRVLARPVYSSINPLFEEWVRRKGREPDWWFQPGGPKSIYGMADSLARRTEYVILYGYWSGLAHGTRHASHFKHHQGSVELEPVRYVPLFPELLHVMFPMTARLIRELTSTYRHGELPQVLEKYVRQWRPRFQVPDIEAQVEHVRF